MTENTAVSKPRPAKPAAPRKPAATKKAAAPAKVAAQPAAAKPKAGKPKTEKKEKKEKSGKSKVVRDSFTMPQDDYDKIAELKQVCQKAGLHVKKSELLRAGLHALARLSVPQLERAIVQLPPIKTGRPKKS